MLLRTGVVLDRLAGRTRWFLGGRIGSGRHWPSPFTVQPENWWNLLTASRAFEVMRANRSGSTSELEIAGPGVEWEFDEVYRRRWPALVRQAYATTGSLAQAEEVVQDVFVALYRNRGAVEQPDGWLRRAVASRTTSWLRRQRLERRHREVLASEAQVPAVAAEFMALLSPLSARQRAVLFLRFHEDLSEHEVAQVLGCRPGTVKSLASRAMARLRKGMIGDA